MPITKFSVKTMMCMQNIFYFHVALHSKNMLIHTPQHHDAACNTSYKLQLNALDKQLSIPVLPTHKGPNYKVSEYISLLSHTLYNTQQEMYRQKMF
jgi:hypothetical protein